MKNINLILIFFFLYISSVFSQNESDSLIHFVDLRYHSDFEKTALTNFIKQHKDTFNLFLAIDDKMTDDKADSDYRTYKELMNELTQQKIQTKKMNTKIKSSYSKVHSLFLKKYNENEIFPEMFKTGTYNCVTASMLYAIIFDQLSIPYKVMASSNHVYLIANPGSNSVVIETTNPGFEQAIFNGEFKQQYVNYLRTSKLISEDDYKRKSIEEIFEEKFKEVKETKFTNLPGFQYYNKALTKFQNNEFEEALQLCQKAYFFYPDQQVKTLLYTILLFQIEKCDFDKISEIDFLAQFSRFENTDVGSIVGIFNHIISHYLQYTDKDEYCESLYQRLISQISNKSMKEEISFNFNMQMSYRYQNTDKIGKYVERALQIKGNHHDANVLMQNYLRGKFYDISDPKTLLDTINLLQNKYHSETIGTLLMEEKLITYLKIANDLCDQKQISSADKYLQDFETSCMLPIKNQMLEVQIESTYHSMAVYFYYKGNKLKSKSYVDRGLKYVPKSRILESVN